jgi:hypothetical protein
LAKAGHLKTFCPTPVQRYDNILNLPNFPLPCFCQYDVGRSGGAIAANGLGIGEVGAFKEQMFNLAQMLKGIPMLKFSTSAPILPIPVWVLAKLGHSRNKCSI